MAERLPLPLPRALLFDAMGTLIGLRTSVGHTYAELAADHGLSVSAAAIDQAFPVVYRQAPPLAFPGLGGSALEAAERTWWGERIDAVLMAAGAGPASAALKQDLFDRFAQPDLWRPYPGVLEHLQRWSRAGLQLAVVSNFDSRLGALLEGLALAPWLQAVVISSAAGAAKPDPLPFQLALEALDVPAAQAWHVGDSPEDGLGAQRAGLRWLRIVHP